MTTTTEFTAKHLRKGETFIGVFSDRNAIIEECAHALERFSLGENSYEQGINEGFRLAAEKLRGMIKNC